VTNSAIPSSTLKKKHKSTAYHHVHEAIAAKVLFIAWVQTGKNLVDLLTKPSPGPTLHSFCKKILHLSKVEDVNHNSS
jgi:hypothetical protein